MKGLTPALFGRALPNIFEARLPRWADDDHAGQVDFPGDPWRPVSGTAPRASYLRVPAHLGGWITRLRLPPGQFHISPSETASNQSR